MLTVNVFIMSFLLFSVTSCFGLHKKEAFLFRTNEFVEILKKTGREYNTQDAQSFLTEKINGINFSALPTGHILGHYLRKLNLPITNVSYNLNDLTYIELFTISSMPMQSVEESMPALLQAISKSNFVNTEDKETDLLIIFDPASHNVSFNKVLENNIGPSDSIFYQYIFIPEQPDNDNNIGQDIIFADQEENKQLGCLCLIGLIYLTLFCCSIGI